MFRTVALAGAIGLATLALAEEGPMPLEGTAWIVMSIEGIDLPDGLYPDMAFGEGRVSGFAGCNRFGGSYEESADGAVTFGPLIATRMACPQPAMSVEAALFAALAQVDRAEFGMDNVLFLHAGDAIVVTAVIMD